MSFEITRDSAIEFLTLLRTAPATGPGDLELLCLQGSSAVDPKRPNVLTLNENTPNYYNDTIVLLQIAEGEERLAAFLGTVDPGDVPVKGGVAHLTHGRHDYIRGFHLRKDYGDKYPCLRALNEINRIWRRREDGTIVVEENGFGVNVHAGGLGELVNDWSKGCLNICGGWNGAPYTYFLHALDIHFLRRGSVGVTIWSGKDFARFLEQGWNMKPTLRLGIRNPWVADLQQALTRKRFFSGKVDGDWREGTELAVRRFQLEAKLAVDGVVGPSTWAALS